MDDSSGDAPLAFDTRGTGERLILLHGFTQTRRSWRPTGDTLSATRRVTAIDLPGHGESAHTDADLPTTANLVVRTGRTGTYVGYSMGGRVALHIALAHREHVERLVLIGATPGIVDPGERSARRAADDEMARRIERLGTDEFLDEWLALPLFAGLSAAQADVDDRRRNTAPHLAASLRHSGTGTQEPLWDRLGEIDVPVLLLVGEHDAKFRGIAEEMQSALAQCDLGVVADAGHSVHLEQPAATLELLTAWLDDHPPSARPTAAIAP